MEIRHPREGDILPIPLEFERYDPEWVWIMGDAILIAAGAHDVVILLRLVKWGEMAEPLWIHRLLRHVLKECQGRGFRRFMTWLAADIENERKLQDIAEKYGAISEPFFGHLAMGAI